MSKAKKKTSTPAVKKSVTKVVKTKKSMQVTEEPVLASAEPDEKGTDIGKRTSKQDILISLLERPDGATLDDLASATGWQRHSVHGVMSGVLKKRLGLTITSNKEVRGRVYRIAGGQ